MKAHILFRTWINRFVRNNSKYILMELEDKESEIERQLEIGDKTYSVIFRRNK